MTTHNPSTGFGGSTSIGDEAEYAPEAGSGDMTMSGGTTTSPGGPESEMASTVADTAQQVAHQAQERAGELVHRATERGREQLTDQKSRAADGLQDLAQATRRAGDDLRAREKTAVADLTDAAASQADRFSRFLRETDVNDMVRGVTDFGRRQPLLFLGGAFAIGLIGARFIKASAQGAQPESENGQHLDDLAGSTGSSRSPRGGRQIAPEGTPRPVGVQALATGRVPSEDF